MIWSNKYFDCELFNHVWRGQEQNQTNHVRLHYRSPKYFKDANLRVASSSHSIPYWKKCAFVSNWEFNIKSELRIEQNFKFVNQNYPEIMSKIWKTDAQCARGHSLSCRVLIIGNRCHRFKNEPGRATLRIKFKQWQHVTYAGKTDWETKHTCITIWNLHKQNDLMTQRRETRWLHGVKQKTISKTKYVVCRGSCLMITHLH